MPERLNLDELDKLDGYIHAIEKQLARLRYQGADARAFCVIRAAAEHALTHLGNGKAYKPVQGRA